MSFWGDNIALGVAALGGGPTIALGFWAIYRNLQERSDKRGSVELSREERAVRDIEQQRQGVAKEISDILNRNKEDIAFFRSRIAEMERERDRMEEDRDRGWDLARYWNRRCHEMRHAAANAQQAVMNILARDPAVEKPAWPDLTLPPFESPFPKQMETK